MATRDGAGLAWAAGCEAFDVLECSINLFDQENLAYLGRGQRVLAKRPLGNAPWRDAHPPEQADRAAYWDRMRAMFEEPPTVEIALGFVLAAGVDCALVGTSSVAHLRQVVEIAPYAAPEMGQRWASASKGAWQAII